MSGLQRLSIFIRRVFGHKAQTGRPHENTSPPVAMRLDTFSDTRQKGLTDNLARAGTPGGKGTQIRPRALATFFFIRLDKMLRL